jgi:cytochrome c peroxidase
VLRGRQLFSSAEAECSSCHDPDRAFSDGSLHEVDPRPSEKGKSYDTPSLRFVTGTAPYFHDGRYATLEDLLTAPDHTMGHSLHLSRDDRLALAAYLGSL